MVNISKTTPKGLAAATSKLVNAANLTRKAAVLGQIAVTVARCADQARISGDVPAYLRAARDLERLLDRLVPDGGDRHEGVADEHGPDESAGLAEILGASAEICDA